MKLLLTSAGLQNKKVLDFFVSILPLDPKSLSVLMVAYAQTEEEQFYIEESKKELLEIGINQISVFDLSEEKFNGTQKFDIIYVCGGNTFTILNRIRITGIDKHIIDKVRNNESIYFGVSAGSIIAGPNILTAGWGSGADDNFVGLKDLTGFQFTNISILPHFEDRYKKELEELRAKVDYQVIELTDDQAVFVDDSGVRLINKP